MTHLERAIRDAVEKGGFDYRKEFEIPKELHFGMGEEISMCWTVLKEKTLLTPAFWRALGKARGWAEEEGQLYDHSAWKVKWHRLIDHLANGGDIERFFEILP